MRLRVLEPDDWLSPFRMKCWSTSPQGGLQEKRVLADEWGEMLSPREWLASRKFVS